MAPFSSNILLSVRLTLKNKFLLLPFILSFVWFFFIVSTFLDTIHLQEVLQHYLLGTENTSSLSFTATTNILLTSIFFLLLWFLGSYFFTCMGMSGILQVLESKEKISFFSKSFFSLVLSFYPTYVKVMLLYLIAYFSPIALFFLEITYIPEPSTLLELLAFLVTALFSLLWMLSLSLRFFFLNAQIYVEKKKKLREIFSISYKKTSSGAWVRVLPIFLIIYVFIATESTLKFFFRKLVTSYFASDPSGILLGILLLAFFLCLLLGFLSTVAHFFYFLSYKDLSKNKS
ncbi:hypothetical protein H6501_04045 [Candidatus Woesearchaeota archaeon]|nr:hypothetical protein [Nanoarchaeota archaeon]MCB9370744.1 hypothetical protein [Candidatus Woesearchaeota archaeon]USN43819.1 MAG: hypothetical protein H6500_05515 [Candidatus Woesearchaeota archaeon]